MNRVMVWQLALRYFKGKGTANAVPLLSRISMVAVAIVSAAMIVLLSVFNGFDRMARNQYKAFYPDIRISAARGKFFDAGSVNIESIKKMAGVTAVAPVLEDNALAGEENELDEAAGRQKVVVVKGIENNYFEVNDVGKYMQEGEAKVSAGKPHTAVLGFHIANALGVDVNNVFSYMQLYYINPAVKNPEADPANAFNSLRLHPSGYFITEDEFDDKYMLAPLALVQELFNAEGKLSSVEIKAKPEAVNSLRTSLQQQLGSAYKVETRYELNRMVYLMLSIEKWVMFVILMFVLFIASFNMVGALTMLVIEKKKDMAILRTMGAQPSLIRAVFLTEGVLWSGMGGLCGLVLGATICIVQQRFGIVQVGEGMLIDAYPVLLAVPDILMVLATTLVVGLAAAWYPARKAVATAAHNLKGNE